MIDIKQAFKNDWINWVIVGSIFIILILCISPSSASINLTDIEISNNTLCEDVNSTIYFRPVDKDGFFTEPTNYKVRVQNIELKKVSYEIYDKAYSFEVYGNVSEIKVDIGVEQNGKVIQRTFYFDVEDCSKTKDNIVDRINRFENLIKNNSTTSIIIALAILGLFFLTILLKSVKT